MYKSPFHSVQITDIGKKKIVSIKSAFDNLYRELHKTCNLKPTKELQEAIMMLRHSCHMYVRACSEQHEQSRESDEKGSEVKQQNERKQPNVVYKKRLNLKGDKG